MRRELEPADLGDLLELPLVAVLATYRAEIAVRYLGVEEGEAFAASTADDIVIRLEPGTLRVWDFADEAE